MRWIDCILTHTTNQDQAGFRFKFSVLKLFSVMIKIYDQRFWDCEKSRFIVPGESRDDNEQYEIEQDLKNHDRMNRD